MKHLKKFNEELKPDTYRSAAYKLRDYNKDKKSKDLLDWADKQEFGYYNMCLVSGSDIIAKNDTFTNPKLIGMYYGDVKTGGARINKPIYQDDILRHSDSEALANRLVNDWKEGRAELAITFEFGFQATSQTKAKHKYLDNPSKETQRWYIGQSVPMFSIELHLSNCYDGIEGWDDDAKWTAEQSGEEFTPTSLYDFYKWTAEESLYLKRPNAEIFYGIFTDRSSVAKFLTFLKSSIDDKVKEKIMDVLSIIGGEAEDLERILNSFNKVRVHGLYDNEFTDSSNGNLAQKWFGKSIA
jgi:hypothetical protein